MKDITDTPAAFPDAVRDTTRKLREVFHPTPLQRNAYLSELYGATIWLKREDLSPVRSYKIRGAFNAIRKQPDHDHFVAASAGNHAQGVAYMCAKRQVKGTIFMPVTTPAQKIERTKGFGGEYVSIKLIGDFFDDTLRAAQTYCAEEGAHFLSPFDDADVIEGQASVALEILQQLGKAPDHVVLPVGGGGLSSGMTHYVNSVGAETRFTYVEPLGGASLQAALTEGSPVTLPRIDTFVDGAAVARIGEKTFAHLKDTAQNQVRVIDENRLCVTITQLLNQEGLVLEPAGALAIDALQDMREEIEGKTVVCIASGGNFDFERLPEVKERAMRYQGKKKYFILRMPQRPGALKDFLNLLGPEDDIARFEYLKKSARNFGTVLIGIESPNPESFDTLMPQMAALGFEHRDITNDPVLGEFLI